MGKSEQKRQSEKERLGTLPDLFRMYGRRGRCGYIVPIIMAIKAWAPEPQIP